MATVSQLATTRATAGATYTTAVANLRAAMVDHAFYLNNLAIGRQVRLRF